MRKYYTRPCNFYYGNYAKKLIKNKKALSLTGNPRIAFDQLEIFQRKRGFTESKRYYLNEINSLDKEKKAAIKLDLKQITKKRKKISNLKFDKPQIMGILNITPDSFSDGGLFFQKNKAYKQARSMINSGAKIIDVGGESTRPGSKVVDEKKEWERIGKIIIKLKKKFS